MSDATSYFAMHPSALETGVPGIWVNTNEDVDPIEMVPGLMFRPIVGKDLAVNIVRFEPHTEAPVHAHPEEQITLVLEGEFEFEVNGEQRILKPGMSVVIPPNAPHGARTFDTTCVEIDVFHPPRKGLLDAMQAQQVRREEGTEAGA